MLLNANDLKDLSGTLQKLDALGGQFSGVLHFTTEFGSQAEVRYEFDQTTSKHYLDFRSFNE